MATPSNNAWNSGPLSAPGYLLMGTGPTSQPFQARAISSTNISWEEGPGSLQANLSGILPVDSGGTGTNYLEVYSVLIGQGTLPIASMPALASGQIVLGTGTAPAPAFLTGTNGISVSFSSGTITVTNSYQLLAYNNPPFSFPSGSAQIGPLSPGYLVVGTGTQSLAINQRIPDGTNIVWSVASGSLLQANLSGAVSEAFGGSGTSSPLAFSVPIMTPTPSQQADFSVLPLYSFSIGTGTLSPPAKSPLVAGQNIVISPTATAITVFSNPPSFYYFGFIYKQPSTGFPPGSPLTIPIFTANWTPIYGLLAGTWSSSFGLTGSDSLVCSTPVGSGGTDLYWIEANTSFSIYQNQNAQFAVIDQNGTSLLVAQTYYTVQGGNQGRVKVTSVSGIVSLSSPNLLKIAVKATALNTLIYVQDATLLAVRLPTPP